MSTLAQLIRDPTADRPPRPRQRFPRSTQIAGALIGVFLIADIAIGLSIWLPFRQEQRIVVEIRELGGKVRLESFDSFGLGPFLNHDQAKVFNRDQSLIGIYAPILRV